MVLQQQIKTRFRRFGSAKVVRSLYKRKSEAESDQSNSDSGYDHNNISPLSSMYGSNVTLPREQVQTKDSATNTSDSDSDSDSASETDSDPESPSFHTVCQDLERMVVQLRQPEDIGEAIAKFSIGVQVPKDAVREVEGLVLDATDGSGRSHSRRRGKHHRRKHFIRDDGSGIVGSIPSPIEEQITPPIETLPRLDESDTGTPLVNADDRSSQLESPKKVRFSETPTYVEPSSPEEGSQLSPIKEDIIMNSAPPPDTSALDTEEQLVKDERFMHGLLSGNEGWPRGEVPEGGENGSVDMDQASEGLVDVDEDVTDSSALHAACGLGEDRGDVDGTQTEVLREEQEFTQHKNMSDFQPSEEISAKESENGKKQPSQTLKSKSESLESASSSSLENNDLSDSIETHFPSESSQSNLSTPATPPPSRASEESNNLNDLDNDIEAEMERLAMSTSTSSETVKSEGYFTPEDIRSPEFMHQLQKFTQDSSDECLSKSEWDRRSMALSEHSTDSNLEYLTPLSETEPFGLDERDKNREAKARIDEELSKSEQLLQEITEAQLFEEKEAIDRVVKEVIESLVNYVVGMCDRLDAVAMETVAKTIVKSSPAKADVKSPVHVSFQSDEIPTPFVNGEISQEFKAEAAVVEVPPEAEETTEILEEPIETVTITQVESVPHDLPDVIKEQVHQHSVQEEEEEVITQETIDPLEQYFITGDSDAASEETIVPSTVQESYTSRTLFQGYCPESEAPGTLKMTPIVTSVTTTRSLWKRPLTMNL
ncbi:uro-adherence factor A-like [Ptychodera flava]|uniref:uro-adherence factor A-like n=1 Tax=Ptychodera flava TaxID=63121 RepID=UPI00396A462F